MDEEFILMNNEKFACLAFEGVELADDIPEYFYLGNNSWVIRRAPFEIDSQWKKWLGTLNTEHLEKSSFVIVSKLHSEQPEVLDEENEDLSKKVHSIWYSILMNGIPQIKGGMSVKGVRHNHSIDVRSAGKSEYFYRPHLVKPKTITKETIVQSVDLSRNLLKLYFRKGTHIRLKKGRYAWHNGLIEERSDIRLHNFVRMIESIIKPRVGRGKRDFVHRASFFFDHKYRTLLLEEIYELRSSVEHLNDWKKILSDYPESDRQEKAFLRSYQAERLASFMLKKSLVNKKLNGILADDESLDLFWKKPDHEKKKIIGDKFDLHSIDVNFRYC